MLELNQVYQGDCFELMQEIDDKSVDMILADLPYNLTSNQWDKELPLDKLWPIYQRILKDNGVAVFTSSQPFSSKLVMSNVKMFRHEWIWVKNRGSNFANTVREPMKEHEHVLVFSRGNWTYNKQMQERSGTGRNRVKYDLNYRSKSSNYRNFEGREDQQRPDLRVPSSVQKFNVCTSKLHPTVKPVPLFEYLVKTYSNEGNVVLDNVAGSGPTGAACQNLNRNYILIEKELEYVEICKQRLKNNYGKER